MPFDREIQETVTLAKSAPETHTRPGWYAIIKSFANRYRERGESEQVAFAKFIEHDPQGIELYKTYRAAPNVIVDEPVRKVEEQQQWTPAMVELRLLAARIRKENPAHLSSAQAMAKALATAEGNALYKSDRTARLGVG